MKLKKFNRLVFTPVLAILIGLESLSAAGQTKSVDDSQRLDSKEQRQVIESLVSQMQQDYVFPEKVNKVAQRLQQSLKSKEFALLNNGNEFAAKVTEQLQQLTGDKHLVVEFNDQPIAIEQDQEAQAQHKAFELAMWRSHNFGVEKVERLKFNIGYFKLSAFGPVNEAGALIAAAMTLLNNSDSLIVDLRGNFGGHERTVQLLASYFFDKRTHLLDMHKRDGNSVEQHWSHEYVQGRRFAQDKDVYILIDQDSFSAAEDFSYTMKHLGRATLIGEVSGGAANSGEMVRLNEHFSVFMPNARGVSPVTKTNWEGTGVTPHILVSGENALKAAKVEILQKQLAQEQEPRRVARIKALIEKLKA